MTIRIRTCLALILGVVVAGLTVVAITPTPPAHADDASGQFVPIAPFRLVDINTGVGGSTTRLGPGQSRDYQILGVGGVPASDVSSVVVDVAVGSLLNATTSSLRVYAPDGPVPDSTVLRVEGGTISRSNTAITKVGSNGKIRVYNANGDVSFNLDVQGYFTTSDSGLGFNPINPIRVVSTSTGTGIAQQQVAPSSTQDLQITNGTTIPSEATAVFANVKVSGAESNGALRLTEGGLTSSAPVSLNYGAGAYMDSGMTIKLSADGKVRLTNTSTVSSIDFHLDVQGYFVDTPGIQGGAFTALANKRVFDTNDSTALGSGETRTVNIAGLEGLPQPGPMSAAVLTVFASNFTASGAVKVWSADSTEPGTTSLTFNTTSHSSLGLSSTSVVRTSLEGAIKIKNTSSAPIRVALSAQGWFSHLETSPPAADASDPVVAAGTVLDTSGSPLGGAKLTLLMWPSETAMDSYQEGDSVNTVAVAVGAANSNGAFSLQLPDVNALLVGAAGDNIVDFSLMAQAPNGDVSTISFSKALLSQTIDGVVRLLVVEVTDIIDGLLDPLLDGLAQTLNWVLPTAGITLQIGESGTGPAVDPETLAVLPDEAPEPPLGDDDAPESSAALSPDPAVDKGCKTEVLKTYAPRWVLVGVHGSRKADVVTDFTYSEGATSTLAVMAKLKNSWKASGSITKAATGSVDYGPRARNGYWARKTKFVFKKFRTYCWSQAGMGVSTYSIDEVRATKWTGEATTVAMGAAPALTNCARLEAHSSFTKQTTKATQWTNGIDLTPEILSIDASVSSGYSRDLKTKFTFPTRGRLCGMADYPGGTRPGTMVARTW